MNHPIAQIENEKLLRYCKHGEIVKSFVVQSWIYAKHDGNYLCCSVNISAQMQTVSGSSALNYEYEKNSNIFYALYAEQSKFYIGFVLTKWTIAKAYQGMLWINYEKVVQESSVLLSINLDLSGDALRHFCIHCKLDCR